MPDHPTPLARAGSTESSCLFLNNYRGGGIGDFGATLAEHLPFGGILPQIEETRPDGRGASDQRRDVRRRAGPVLANVGLTAWGASGARNYLGFRALGARARSGRRTVALVHHAIEMFELSETGYPVSRLVRWGAHRAIAALRECDLVVFAPRLRDLLARSYAARSVWLTPMPTGEPRQVAKPDGPWKVVTAGYLAPYKGVDAFLDLAQRLGGSVDSSLIGRPHRVLSERPEFAARARDWQDRAHALGVATPGFLPAAGLDTALGGRSIGVLPYSSSSGASASFGLFAERGVPVISSALPEFQYLAAEGAGIVPVPPTVDRLEAAVRELTGSPDRWLELARRQADFARRHSWDRFAADLGERFPVLRAAR